MNTMPLDPLAAAVHAHIEQLRREADAETGSPEALATGAARTSWPAGIAAALRDSVTAALNGRAHSPNRSGAACCV